MEKKTENSTQNFKQEVEIFTDHIDSLFQTSPMVNIILKVTQITSEKKEMNILKRME